MRKLELATTVRVSKETKDVLANLDLARKNDSYNDIILKLVKEYRGGVR